MRQEFYWHGKNGFALGKLACLKNYQCGTKNWITKEKLYLLKLIEKRYYLGFPRYIECSKYHSQKNVR